MRKCWACSRQAISGKSRYKDCLLEVAREKDADKRQVKAPIVQVFHDTLQEISVVLLTTGIAPPPPPTSKAILNMFYRSCSEWLHEPGLAPTVSLLVKLLVLKILLLSILLYSNMRQTNYALYSGINKYIGITGVCSPAMPLTVVVRAVNVWADNMKTVVQSRNDKENISSFTGGISSDFISKAAIDVICASFHVMLYSVTATVKAL